MIVKTRIAALCSALLATTMLLGACGGGSDPTVSRPTGRVDTSTQGAGKPPITQVETTVRARREHHEATSERRDHADGALTSEPEKASSLAKKDPVEGQDSPPQTTADTSGCPPQLTRRECNDLATAMATGKNSSDKPIKAGQCPSSLGQAECAELEEAADGASSNQTLPFEQCPEGLSAAQCRELEEAVSR